MHIPDDLLSVYTAEIQERDGEYVVRVPERELTHGQIERGDVHRVAIVSQSTEEPPATGDKSVVADEPPDPEPSSAPRGEYDDPPVSAGDQRVAVIESTGDEGDGIAKIDRGYVVIVPQAKQGDKVRIELDTVRENVGFGHVVEQLN